MKIGDIIQKRLECVLSKVNSKKLDEWGTGASNGGGICKKWSGEIKNETFLVKYYMFPKQNYKKFNAYIGSKRFETNNITEFLNYLDEV